MSWAVDASAAVEVLLRSQLGEEVLKAIGSAPLCAPDLLDAEVLAVLRREVLRGSIKELRARQALEDLHAWPIRRIPNGTLVQVAWRWRSRLSAYDALYVAAAATARASLVTADGPLARCARLPITIHNVRH